MSQQCLFCRRRALTYTPCRVFTYVVLLDGMFRFTETGKECRSVLHGLEDSGAEGRLTLQPDL